MKKEWIIISISILIGVLCFSLIPFDGGDNFAYYYLSESLLSGQGYKSIWLIDESINGHFPFGLPILLLPATLLNSYTAGKVIIFLFFIGTLLITAKLYETEVKPVRITALLLFAMSPVLWEYSHYILSEIPFVFFSVLAVWLYKKNCVPLAMLSAIGTFYIRFVGLILVLVMMIMAVVEYRDRKLLWNFIGLYSITILLVGFWLIWSHLHPTNPYLQYIGLSRLVVNIKCLCLPIMRKFYCIGILPLIFFGLGFWQTKGDRFLKVYMLAYMGFILLWRWGWDYRMYIPLLPFFALYIAKGIHYLSQKIGRENPLTKVVLGLYLICMGANVMCVIPKNINDNINWIKYRQLPEDKKYWGFKFFISLERDIKEGKYPDDAEFTTPKVKTFYHFTKRKAHQAIDNQIRVRYKREGQ